MIGQFQKIKSKMLKKRQKETDRPTHISVLDCMETWPRAERNLSNNEKGGKLEFSFKNYSSAYIKNIHRIII